MSSAPAMTGGMTGKAQTSTLNMMPGGGQGSEEIIDIPPAYKSEPIAPKLYPNNIDYSTRRSVLPCKGITHRVLRPEPPPASAGMIFGHRPALPGHPSANGRENAKNRPLAGQSGLVIGIVTSSSACNVPGAPADASCCPQPQGSLTGKG